MSELTILDLIDINNRIRGLEDRIDKLEYEKQELESKIATLESDVKYIMYKDN